MWVIIPLLRWDCWEETWDPRSLWSVQTQKLTKLMIWASKVKSFRNNWKEKLVMMTPGHHCTAWSDLAISPCRSSQRGRVLCPGWKVTTHYARRRHLYPAQSQSVCVCARACTHRMMANQLISHTVLFCAYFWGYSNLDMLLIWPNLNCHSCP